ncbi:MAG: hypothetical protein SGARI_001464 [Bacillariaceae sp.]
MGMVDAAAVRRANGNMLSINDLNKMDQAALLRNAIKIDKRLAHRMLEDQGEEGENEDEGEEENEENEENDQEEEENGDEENNEEEEENNEEDEEQEEEGEQEEEEDAEEEAEEEEEQQILQLGFLKCGAFTVDPNVVDVDAMVEAGEIDEDEAAEMKAMYVTEVSDYVKTQESIVFFTVAYSQNDEYRELYMTTLENWISASMGYEDICHQLDEDDVDTIFSTVTDETFADMYSGHSWYSGFNCLEDGSGFGTQLFLDETCNTYAPTMETYYPFPEGSNMGAGNQQEEDGEEEQENANVDYTYRVASDLTPYMIQNADYFLGNVHYCEEVEGQEEEEGEEGEDEMMDSKEFCENLFEISVNTVTCAAYGEEAKEDEEEEQQECNCDEQEAEEQEEQDQAEGDEEQEEGDEQDEAEGEEEQGEEEEQGGERRKRRRIQECNCDQQDNGYQINYDEIGDVEQSCSTVRNLLNIDPNNFSGANAEYVVSMWSNARDGQQSDGSNGLRRGWIIAISIVAAVAVCALLWCMCCAGKKKKSAAGSGDKNEPLVSSANKPPRKKKESIEIYFQGSKRDVNEE